MVLIREMRINDHDALVRLMRCTPGISIRDADSREATERYLARNPGLSFIAEVDGQVVGCLMSGHDGRRGYLQHLIVSPQFRKQGIASGLIEQCLAGLEAVGISKSHLDVLTSNQAAIEYWTRRAWTRRDDIVRFSFIRSGGPDV